MIEYRFRDAFRRKARSMPSRVYRGDGRRLCDRCARHLKRTVETPVPTRLVEFLDTPPLLCYNEINNTKGGGDMNWLKTLFKRTKQTSPIPMPPYDEIVKSLYDKELVCSDELKICKVIYNKDNSKRFVILESKKGFFKYTYEEICVFDELDWNDHYCYIENIKPGWWEPKDSSFAYSFFGTENEAIISLKSEPIYRQYFE